MRSATRLLTALILAASAAASMAQSPPQTAAASPKSRAEVLADLEMYQRSGLGSMTSFTGYIDIGSSAEYRKAYAEYLRLLASPDYTAAVAKYQSKMAGR